MNLFSYNVRECGDSMKMRRLCQSLDRGMTNICFIQDLKLQSLNNQVIKGLWGNRDIEWSGKAAEGQSGGIITMW